MGLVQRFALYKATSPPDNVGLHGGSPDVHNMQREHIPADESGQYQALEISDAQHQSLHSSVGNPHLAATIATHTGSLSGHSIQCALVRCHVCMPGAGLSVLWHASLFCSSDAYPH